MGRAKCEMKAVAYIHIRPVVDEEGFSMGNCPTRPPKHHDILMEVKAVSVNPVGTKIRRRSDPVGEPGTLGFDTAGVFSVFGPALTLFGVRNAVW